MLSFRTSCTHKEQTFIHVPKTLNTKTTTKHIVNAQRPSTCFSELRWCAQCIVFALKIGLSSRQSLWFKHIIFTQRNGHLSSWLYCVQHSPETIMVPPSRAMGPVSFHPDMSLATPAPCQFCGLARLTPPAGYEFNWNKYFDVGSMASINDCFDSTLEFHVWTRWYSTFLRDGWLQWDPGSTGCGPVQRQSTFWKLSKWRTKPCRQSCGATGSSDGCTTSKHWK